MQTGKATTASELLKKGLGELQRGELQAAQADLRAASQLDGQNPYVWTALADAYWQNGDRNGAAAAATKAEQQGQGNATAVHALAIYFAKTGQNEKALVLAKQAARTSPPEASYQLAQLLLRAQDFTAAADLIETALASHKGDPQLTLALGVARYGQRRFADAIDSFLNVIKLDSDIEQPYVFLAKMLDQAGPQLGEIAQLTKTWAGRHSGDAEAQLVLAKVLLAENRTCSECEALLRRSIELKGDEWESHYQLGLLLAGRHDYPRAVTELKRATELAPRQPMPHYHLARAYDRTGHPDEAAAERILHQQLQK